MRMPHDLLDDQARQRARPDDQQALAAAAKVADAAVDTGSEQEYQNDEARVERAVFVAELGIGRASCRERVLLGV